MDAALDPSCIGLFTPLGWWSPTRPGVVWPGAPRNFATEPATWYDVNVKSPEIGKANFLFELEYRYGDTYWYNPVSGSPVFYNLSGYQPFGVILRPTFEQTITVANLFSDVGVRFFNYPSENFELGKIHKLSILRQNGIAAVLMNGDEIYSYSGTSPASIYTAWLASAFDGNLLSARLTNLDSGSIVWSYPSYAERLRLITSTNVLSTGTHWEAANPAVAARIDTALDLRGRGSDYTSIVDFEAASLTASGQKQELAGQGPSVSGSAIPICALAYAYILVPLIQAKTEIGGVAVTFQYALPSVLTGRHTAGLRIQTNAVANQTTLTIFVDGTARKSQTFSGLPTGSAYSAYTCFSINDNRAGSGTNFFGKFYAAALFNEALTDGQIAYLSN